MLEKYPSIYIVEDEPVLHDQLLYSLRGRGFNVIGSSISGDRAVHDIILKEKVPDVIVLDLNLPMLDTASFGRIIRSRYPHVKFIYIVSDFRDKKRLEEVKKLGGIPVKRPINLSDILRAIKQLTQT